MGMSYIVQNMFKITRNKESPRADKHEDKIVLSEAGRNAIGKRESFFLIAGLSLIFCLDNCVLLFT